MATLAEQADIYNEAIAQGLTQQEAIDTAGIQDFDQFVFVDGLLTARVPASAFVLGPEDVEDTGGVPTQNLATLFEDPGLVPQPQQSAAGDPQAGGFVFGPDGELLPADSAEAQAIVAQQQQVQNATPAPVDDTFLALPDGTGTFGVWSNSEGRFVVQGLTEQEATLRAEEFNTLGFDAPEAQVNAATRQTDFETAAANEAAIRERARVQATLSNQLRQADSGDWRFRIRLAPGARYLYRGDDGQGVQSGILAPLAVTDGVIFPYTPQITTAYRARYAEQDLPHSNYRGYFYSGSNPETVNVQATFTAQDTTEANYLLAVIHFFRSVTKMFYGQNDTNRGAPPPLVFLQGFGAYQFARHPCVVTNFNYVLPADVDYIRADVQPITGLNIQQQRRSGAQRQSVPTNVFVGALARLTNAGATKGAIYRPPAADTLGTIVPTYVPTKMDMTIEMLPMQTRQQVSQEFSLKDFASGNLQRKGFW